MPTPCTPPVWADVSIAFLTLVMFALTGIVSLLLTRAAIGKVRYGWGGKLAKERSKKNRRGSAGAPKQGGAGYEYYKLKKPGWMPSSMALLAFWALAYLFAGYAFWRLFHGTCGFDNLYTSLAAIVVALSLVMQLLWSYTWYSMRHALAGILCAVAVLALAIVSLVIYAQTALAGAITWTAFAVQLVYALWVLVALALLIHMRALNYKLPHFFIPKGRRSDDTDTNEYGEDPNTGIFYVTVEEDDKRRGSSHLYHF